MQDHLLGIYRSPQYYGFTASTLSSPTSHMEEHERYKITQDYKHYVLATSYEDLLRALGILELLCIF